MSQSTQPSRVAMEAVRLLRQQATALTSASGRLTEMAQTNIPQREELLCSCKTMGVFISSALVAFSAAEHLLHQAAQIELGDDAFRTPERVAQLDALLDSADVFSETGELLLYTADNVATFYIQTGHAIASDVPGRASARRSNLAISRKDAACTTPTA